jgi:hypothetical protein
MKSFQELYTEIQDQTFDTSAAGLIIIKRRINDGIKYLARRTKGVFLDKSSTLTTTASTQFKDVPFDVGKIKSIYVTVSSRRYTPKECPSRVMWDRLNASTYTSDIPEWFFVDNSTNGQQLGLFPVPATSSNVITILHKKRLRDLVFPDYTTGTIVSIANGATTVTGSGTTWTSKMVGRWIRINLTDTATTGDGDGEWYQIASRTSNTILELAKNYNGTTISAGGATYAIGEISPVPEGHENGITDYVLERHYRRIGDNTTADEYKLSLEQHIKELMNDSGSQTENLVLDYGDTYTQNDPNLFITL